MTDRHIHIFNKIVLVRVVRVTNRHYKGTAGDKAFLFYACLCKHRQAFDYGDYKKMRVKLNRMNKAARQKALTL